MPRNPSRLSLLFDGQKPAHRLDSGEYRPRRTLAVAALAVAFLSVSTAAHPTPRVVWNASRSAPLGLYWVVVGDIKRGDFVLAQLPSFARELAARRGYLPANVPLVKRVAAITGDAVCSVQRLIIINGRIAAKELERDARGRALPSWEGCFPLREGEYFLLMEGVPDSFDGRYFGPINRTQIIGKLLPIWTW